MGLCQPEPERPMRCSGSKEFDEINLVEAKEESDEPASTQKDINDTVTAWSQVGSQTLFSNTSRNHFCTLVFSLRCNTHAK